MYDNTEYDHVEHTKLYGKTCWTKMKKKLVKEYD